MPKLLKNLKIATIGSVDRPANGEATVSLIKRADDAGGSNNNILGDILKSLSTKEKMLLLTKGLFGGSGDEGEAKDLNGILADRDRDEMLWRLTSALRESLDSILEDETVTDKKTAIAQVLQQFFNALMGGTLAKAGRKISGNRLSMLQQMKAMLDKLIAEAEPPANEPDDNGGVGKRGEENNLPINDEVRKSLPAEVQAYLEDLEKRAASNPGGGTDPTPGTGGQEDIWKGVNPAVRAMVEGLEKRAKDAETLAKSIQEEQKNKEYLAKAASFSHLGVSVDDVVALFKGYDGNPELTAKVEGVLKAANEQISKGALFAEFGRSGGSGAGGDALAKAEALAGEMVQKNAGGMTKDQALTKVWQSNPDLYKDYQAEKKELLRRMS